MLTTRVLYRDSCRKRGLRADGGQSLAEFDAQPCTTTRG